MHSPLNKDSYSKQSGLPQGLKFENGFKNESLSNFMNQDWDFENTYRTEYDQYSKTSNKCLA